MSTEQSGSPTVAVVGSDNHGITMTIDSIPVPGETVLGEDFTEGVGGKGSNQAIAASRLGADASFVGRVGEDRYADRAFDLWDREGVDATAVTRTDGIHTGVGIVLVEDAGENAIGVAPGANGTLDAGDVRDAAGAVEAADVVLTQLETEIEPVETTLSLATAAGTSAILNPVPATELPPDLLEQADFLTPNRSEARLLTGVDPDADIEDIDLARDLVEMGANVVVLTQGADGALVVTASEVTSIPAPDIEVVDTTGAGDAFNAGFAVALAEGADPVEAAKFASLADGLACTDYEVVPALPDRDAVELLTST
ncbi:ribokinase [Halorhabdus amylolytica]|uniref:ribokinase n=1 Tax=Halorhabdus amylolytica TaxID=2559573 RepID=UPI0010AAC99F|nr:ribokinase [Halorhabdus amylolytica]